MTLWDKTALLCLLLLGAREYPVLDRRPGSNDLELDFRWVCAVSCARNQFPYHPCKDQSNALNAILIGRKTVGVRGAVN